MRYHWLCMLRDKHDFASFMDAVNDYHAQEYRLVSVFATEKDWHAVFKSPEAMSEAAIRDFFQAMARLAELMGKTPPTDPKG